MSFLRIASVLALLLLVGTVAPLSAAEPSAPAAPPATAAPAVDLLPLFTSAPHLAANFCPTYFCVQFQGDCSCDWIVCPDGSVVCGVWDGTSAMTPAPGALPALFRF